MTKRSILLATCLLPAAVASAADKPAKPEVVDPDKMVCKRQTTIGSLVATRKVCMTRAQWTTQRDQAQASAARMQNTGFSEPRE